MKNLHLILILIAALWNLIPSGTNPFRPLFDLEEDPYGDVTTQGDPETDPMMINMPPPR